MTEFLSCHAFRKVKKLLHGIVQLLQEGQRRKNVCQRTTTTTKKNTSKNVSQKSKRISAAFSIRPHFRRPTTEVNLINSGLIV